MTLSSWIEMRCEPPAFDWSVYLDGRRIAAGRTYAAALRIVNRYADDSRDPLAGMRGPDGELGTDIEPEQYLAARDAEAEADAS